MTGREQRVLSGYTALGAKKTAEPSDEEKSSVGINKDKFQLEKLAYNLDTIVDFCEHVSHIFLRDLYSVFHFYFFLL